MKKYLFLSLLLLLVSCSSNQKAIEQTKQELLSDSGASSTVLETQDMSEASGEVLESNNIDTLDNLNFISISQEDIVRLSPQEVEIRGTVNDPQVEKITVEFQNRDSQFPSDSYTLKTYKPGDKSFRYLASANFKVLAYGENIYTFSAFKGKEISRSQLRIVIDEETVSNTPVEKNTTDILTSLPKDALLGDPIKIGDTSFTYSQVKGFLAQKENGISLFDCRDFEKVTSSLVTKFGYVYWNTCRDIVPGKSQSINILRIEKENYVYEKYFIDSYNSLSATYLLESGTGSRDTLESTNTTLREKKFIEADKFTQFFKTIASK